MSLVDYVHLDDQSIATGGTSLTGAAILEDRMDNILSLSCQDLTIEEVRRYQNKLWIIGNITNLYRLDPNIINELLSNNFFVKIEFDYFLSKLCQLIQLDYQFFFHKILSSLDL